MKPFTTLACLLLAAIAVLQIARLLLGWEISLNGVPMPLWPSAVAAPVAAIVAAMTWRERSR